jgi:uncharacterized membrane protein
MLSEIKQQKLAIGDILAAAWDVFEERSLTVVAIALTTFIPYYVLFILMMPSKEAIPHLGSLRLQLVWLLIGFITTVIGAFQVMAIAFIVERFLAGEEITYGQALRKSLSRWGAAIIAGIMAHAIILVLLILCIVPGIVAAVYLAFVTYAVVLRDKSGKAALKYSHSLVKGQWWRVFWIVLGLLALNVLVGAIPKLALGLFPSNFFRSAVSTAVISAISSFFIVAKTIFFLNMDYLHTAQAEAESASPPPSNAQRSIS